MPSQIVFPPRQVIHLLFSLPIESLLCIWQDDSTHSCHVVSLFLIHKDRHYAVLLEHKELRNQFRATTFVLQYNMYTVCMYGNAVQHNN